MVEAQGRQAAEAGRDEYYMPHRIDEWLSRWPELVEMAMQTPGSTSRIDPTPGRPRGSYVLPPSFSLANIVADIESAWNALGPETTGYKLIYVVMQGYCVPEAGELVGLGRSLAWLTYWGAVREMARSLGWSSADGEARRG